MLGESSYIVISILYRLTLLFTQFNWILDFPWWYYSILSDEMHKSWRSENVSVTFNTNRTISDKFDSFVNGIINYCRWRIIITVYFRTMAIVLSIHFASNARQMNGQKRAFLTIRYLQCKRTFSSLCLEGHTLNPSSPNPSEHGLCQAYNKNDDCTTLLRSKPQ